MPDRVLVNDWMNGVLQYYRQMFSKGKSVFKKPNMDFGVRWVCVCACVLNHNPTMYNMDIGRKKVQARVSEHVLKNKDKLF